MILTISPEEYRNIDALSYSYLGRMLNPRATVLEIARDESLFRVGAAVDHLLTRPDDPFTDYFDIVPINKPSGLLLTFIKALPKGITPQSPTEDYRTAYEYSGYKKPIERVIEDFWKNPSAVSYYKHLHPEGNKIPITLDEYQRALWAKKSIEITPFALAYFHPQHEHIEIRRQVPIVFELFGKTCKALLDGILINHEQKQITPYDLKTMSADPAHFERVFYELGYYRQAAFYTEALKSVADTWQGYKLMPFEFIVVSTKIDDASCPLIWRTNNVLLEAALNGGSYGYRTLIGVKDLIEAMEYYQRTEDYRVPYHILQRKGIYYL